MRSARAVIEGRPAGCHRFEVRVPRYTLAAVLIVGLLAASGALAAPPATQSSSAPRPAIDARKYFDAASATAGLQAAIDAADSAGGGVVLLPPGVYTLRRSLVLPGGVTLRGSGPATVLRKGPGSVSLLSADVGVGATEVLAADASGFRPGDEICIRDNRRSGWHAHSAIVRAVDGKWITFDTPTQRAYKANLVAVVFGFHPAVVARDQSGLAIEALRIDAKPDEQAAEVVPEFIYAAIHLVRCSQARVRDVSVVDWPSDGVSVQGGRDIQVIGCTVAGGRGHGFHPGTSLADAVFTGNIARGNGQDGLYFCAGVRRCTVGNNVFAGNGWNGIGGLGEAGDEWNTCTGNTCADNGRCGIQLSDGRNNVATGNVCVNNSKSQPGEFPGILLHNTHGSVVSANRCGDDQDSPTQRVGIRETGDSDRNVISGNSTAGSLKGIEVRGKNTLTSANLE